jgi:hypothetical protein
MSKRDRKLLAALVLFLISGVSVFVQVWISNLYYFSLINRDWTFFLQFFPSYALPPPEPGTACLDWCYPDKPVFAAWTALGSFVLGVSVLAYAWFRSKRL